MADEQGMTESTPEDTGAGSAKQKRAGAGKGRKSHGERALASIRAANKDQQEVSDPAERARFLLAEANVLALLDVADALGGGSSSDAGQAEADGAGSE
jgi:hypothetical protein